MSDLTLRIATPRDIESVAGLFNLYRQFYEQPDDLPLATAFIRERMTQNESLVILAESTAGLPIGFCQLYPSFCSVEAKPIYLLYDLFVLPDYRECGAGRRLLIEAEHQARIRGKARMDLTTAKDNLKAQSVYESLGWVRDEVFFAYSKSINLPLACANVPTPGSA